MQAEGGQQLENILSLKESERAAGGGVFWWGVGNSLGEAVHEAAAKAGGSLPILFSRMKARPQKKDVEPERVLLWTEWEDRRGQLHPIPPHVLEWSRGYVGKKTHYALVCCSTAPLVLGKDRFDPNRYRTRRGKKLAATKVTHLIDGNPEGDHSTGGYDWGFRANLVSPWAVKLVHPRPVSPEDIRAWTNDGDWQQFVDNIRCQKT